MGVTTKVVLTKVYHEWLQPFRIARNFHVPLSLSKKNMKAQCSIPHRNLSTSFVTSFALTPMWGGVILDNCIGSGTTAIACIKEHRHYIGFELNKEYYDKACQRIEEERKQLTLNFYS